MSIEQRDHRSTLLGSASRKTVPDPAFLLRELTLRNLVPDDALAVYSVGSVARGWHNSGSDFDFTVVTPREPAVGGAEYFTVPLKQGRVASASFRAYGRSWEIKYWTAAQVEEMLSKVTWERFEAAVTAPEKVLSEAEEIFIERLFSGVALIGEGWLGGHKERAGRSAFRAFLVTRSLAQSDGYVEDAVGQLASVDLTSAVLSARSAFGHAVDALLESYGCYGSRSVKWRARRFAEVSSETLSFDAYWEIEAMRGYTDEGAHDWVMEVLKECRRISSAIDLE